MLVVIVGLTTAAALASVTVKFSGPSTHRILRGGDRKTQQRRTRRQVGGGGVRRRHMDCAVRVSC